MIWVKIFIITSFFTNLAFAITYPPGLSRSRSSTQTPGTLSEECKSFISNLPLEYKRGWVQVPEDYSKPNGNKIHVFWYTRLKSSQMPVAFFYGGPLATDRFHYEPFQAQEDSKNLGFVFIDQRGTGCSSSPAPLRDVQTAAQWSLYSSDAIVKDAEIIRTKLIGQHKWKIFGQSYGGVIVSRYVSLYPNSLVSAYAYAGSPLANMKNFMRERILSNNRVAGEFLKQFPLTKESLITIRQGLSADQCLTYPATGGQACGKSLFNLILDVYLGEPSAWADFASKVDSPRRCSAPPCILNSQNKLNPDFVESFIADFDFIISFWFDEQVQLTNLAVWRQEFTFPSAGSDFMDVCEVVESELKKSGLDPKKLFANHCEIIRLDQNFQNKSFIRKVFSKIPVRSTLTPMHVLEGLKRNPNLRLNLYAGSLDFIDADIGIYQLLDQDRQVSFTIFKDGHFGYLNQEKFWSDLAQ